MQFFIRDTFVGFFFGDITEFYLMLILNDDGVQIGLLIFFYLIKNDFLKEPGFISYLKLYINHVAAK